MKLNETLLFTFAAGFVDTATFVGADKVFSAHVTGNFIVFASALINGISSNDFLKLLTFPVFVLTVMATTYFYNYSIKTIAQKNKLIIIFDSLLILIVGFVFASASFFKVNLSQFYINLLIVGLVASMAILNAYHRIVMPNKPAMTVMTGNVTTLSLGIINFFLRKNDSPLFSKQEEFKRLVLLSKIVVIFTLGCACAAYLTKEYGLASVIVPGLFIFVTGFHD